MDLRVVIVKRSGASIRLAFKFLFFLAVQGCSLGWRDTFNSTVLESSKNEKLYVNTLNWGVTDDHQISAISLDADKLRDRSDTLGSIEGLDPFIYRFKDDTLTLYFDGEANYHLSDEIKTIYVNYRALDKAQYNTTYLKAMHNIEEYRTVPKRR